MFCLIFLIGHIVLVTELMAKLCRYTLSYERLMELYYWAKAIVCFSQN